jgi:hypothetical protein
MKLQACFQLKSKKAFNFAILQTFLQNLDTKAGNACIKTIVSVIMGSPREAISYSMHEIS